MRTACLFILTFFLLAPVLAVGQPTAVSEAGFIRIGGLEQWVTIESADRSNPVILFLHGGPGSTMTPYSEAVYGQWKKEFTLVNWDQRGAGRTYGRNVPDGAGEEFWAEHPLTVERMTADGIELSEYLVKNFGKRKIILVATSWGSVLGARMALARPDLFLAYVGHSQIVNSAEGFKHAFENTLRLARDAGDA
ncbi:MAG TPA: alpha/beta fold hydrolase, partial [Sphingobacteriaceae bacterium]